MVEDCCCEQLTIDDCSGHHHQSLWSAGHAENLFSDPSAPDGMSDLFRSYLAGQLAYLGELLPMVAPTVNSYKRLVEGFWAPTRPTGLPS